MFEIFQISNVTNEHFNNFDCLESSLLTPSDSETNYHRVRINNPPPLVSKSANCLVWGSILLKSQTNPDPGFYFLK